MNVIKMSALCWLAEVPFSVYCYNNLVAFNIDQHLVTELLIEMDAVNNQIDSNN